MLVKKSACEVFIFLVGISLFIFFAGFAIYIYVEFSRPALEKSIMLVSQIDLIGHAFTKWLIAILLCFCFVFLQRDFAEHVGWLEDRAGARMMSRRKCIVFITRWRKTRCSEYLKSAIRKKKLFNDKITKRD